MIAKFYLRGLGLAAASVLMPAAMAFAQMPGGSGMPAPGPQPGPVPHAPGAPGTVTNLPEESSQQDAVDRSFVRETLENNQNQIRLSRIAQSKSSSPDVKQLSGQIVKLHGELDRQLQPVVSPLGVYVSGKPSKKDKKEMDTLQALSGPNFDSAYLDTIGRMQRESLKEFHEEARDSQNASLRKAASEDARALAGQYQALEKVALAHHVELGGVPKK